MKRGEIYILETQESKGNIQAGKRPVIVVQNDIGNTHSLTTIVCCITSKTKKGLPMHLEIGKVGGLKLDSTILCEQILTVNKSDLRQYVGAVTNTDTLKRLDRCLSLSLGINNRRKEYVINIRPDARTSIRNRITR